MNKRKGTILTLALIVVAGAAVVGSRMWKNSKHNEVNTETENASEQIAQETQEHVAGRDSSEDVQQETPDVQKLRQIPSRLTGKTLTWTIRPLPATKTPEQLRPIRM